MKPARRPLLPCVLAAGLLAAALPAGAQPPAAPLWRQGRASGSAKLPLAALVLRTRGGVVQVRGQLSGRAAQSAGGRLSVGTGFIISAAGYVVTNEHVVRDSEHVAVRLSDGRELEACVQGSDAITDIALLKVRSTRALDVLPLGDPRSVRAGDEVFVIGNPFGFDHSVTAGILSAKDRIVERQASAENTAASPYAFYLQTDAAINMGNSGGPLLSRQGFVIGVASAFWGGSQPAQGIGFAIPIDVVRQMLPQLASTGHVSRSWVGVDVQSIDPSLAEAFALPSTQGALLASVKANGPAARAGFAAGDVIAAWGEHVIAGVEDFKIYAQLTPAGQDVQVKLLRAGRTVRASLRTAAAPNLATFVRHPATCSEKGAPDRPALGVELGKKIAEGGGVTVRTVSAGAGRQAGLLPGDVILAVGNVALKDPNDFKRALQAKVNPLLVRREDSNFWVALPSFAPSL